MNEFKALKFIRETRDKMYEETKNKTKEEMIHYYKKKAGWLNSSVGRTISKTIKKKSRS